MSTIKILFTTFLLASAQSYCAVLIDILPEEPQPPKVDKPKLLPKVDILKLLPQDNPAQLGKLLTQYPNISTLDLSDTEITVEELEQEMTADGPEEENPDYTPPDRIILPGNAPKNKAKRLAQRVCEVLSGSSYNDPHKMEQLSEERIIPK